ncbi:CAP domain-containing protein [Alkaliphilus transvaalensis]|uniref:CAP domain-containing protein n=1 Tax=Alkaliphilus transvaalensis TaxID=114628 RepID=UPI000A00D2EF|nr:CAP domain-containing protein [Alkaliphilus transvaalensis]
MIKTKKIYLLVAFLLISFMIVSCRDHLPPKVAIKNSSIYKEGEVKEILIKEDMTEVYSGKNPNLSVVATYNNGDLLKVIGVTDDWYVVLLEDQQVGCVEKSKAVPYVEGRDTKDNVILDDHLLAEEKEMVDLINKERIEVGLEPLIIDLTLTKIARLKSKDLIEENYFNHYSPTYGSPFEMMEKYKIDYLFAGENLAGHNSVIGAHHSLMNSTTHRQNILNPTFTHIGIGMEKGGPYGKVFTQMFIGR